MTKPLNTQLSQQDGPVPRSGSRTRTWLVALLGFGAADLLVLNLWAIPKLIAPTATTTDIRAAQSGDQQAAPSTPEPQLQPAAAVAAQVAEPKQPDTAPDRAAQAEAPGAEVAADQEPAAEAPAAPAVPAESPAEEGARKYEAELARAAPAPQPSAAQLKPRENPPEPEAAQPPAPAQPPAGVTAEAYAPAESSASSAFAIRAAQRAVQLALADRSASNNPFAGLTESDKPLSQIFFSMGNFMLGPNGKQVLERLLPQLTSDDRPVLIVGSADPSGSEPINEKLSDARAQSVAEWMLVHGVDAGRIHTRAIGHEGAVGSTLDRRVDIWLGGSR